MKQYAEILNNYLSENPPEMTQCQMERILDMLYCCYSQRKGRDTEQVRRSFEQMNRILERLPIKQQDALVDIACGLCADYQSEGFRDGVMVGFRLFQELS